MAKITQAQLIGQIKTLKEIKPRKEWVILLKSQILTESTATAKTRVVGQQTKLAGIMDILSAVFIQRKLAYAFAVILFLIVGVFGFAVNTVPGDLLFPIKKISEQSQAALSGQTNLQNNVAILNSRINDLVQIAKEGRTDNIPSAISEVNAKASELAQNLKDNPTQNAETLKEIINSYKTLANIPGTDLTASPGINDLARTLAQDEIADLNKTTLTDNQKDSLTQAEDLYNQGKYTDALEKILLINK